MKTKFVKFAAILFIASMTSCAREQPQPETIVVVDRFVESRPAPPPPGTVQYCWEEPIVDREEVAPGLNTKGDWYNPAHTVVKKVRQGRWRPCKVQRSKSSYRKK